MNDLKFTIAIATDDGKHIVNKHFGDATFYDIYRLENKECVYIERVKNTTRNVEEKKHGDPRKAKAVIELLKKYNVDFLVSKRFGQNITRIIKYFIPVVVKVDEISDLIKKLTENEVTEKLVKELEKDVEERKPVFV